MNERVGDVNRNSVKQIKTNSIGGFCSFGEDFNKSRETDTPLQLSVIEGEQSRYHASDNFPRGSQLGNEGTCSQL